MTDIRRIAEMLIQEHSEELKQISEQLKECGCEPKSRHNALEGLSPEEMEVVKSLEYEREGRAKNRGHNTQDWQRHKAKMKRKRRNKRKLS